MGLVLLRDRTGDYRRTWYAIVTVNGKRTCRSLDVPVKGQIPVDELGNFSLLLSGDEAFERCKTAATDALVAYRKKLRENKTAAREAADAIGVQRIRIADWARKNAERKKYEIAETGDVAQDKRNNKYNQSVFDIIEHFATWTRRHHARTPGKSYAHITDIDRELVSAYYATLGDTFSWQTFRKYVFILKSSFAFFTNGKCENHFAKIYDEEYKGRKSAIADKSEIAHKPPTDAEIARLWRHTQSLTHKPYLHRLAVLAACSGLRIGDCCTLTWDRVDLIKMLLTVRTSKTNTDVAIPIFDYVQGVKDYHPIFGELRRELEAALAEREDSERYVIPEAARIYQSNPTRINREGKAIFARALAPEQKVEDAVLVEDTATHASPEAILQVLEQSSFTETKKSRIRTVYEFYTAGKTYSQIAALIGKTKGAVSEDLAALEDLTGVKLRKGMTHPDATRLSTLLKKTRSERKQGMRSACLYGWHSCRMFFVVTARRAGIDPELLKKITGHATVRMVEHYNNADKVEAANALREQMSQPKAKHTTMAQPPQPALPTPSAETLAATLQAILASTDLTPEAKNAAILALTARA